MKVLLPKSGISFVLIWMIASLFPLGLGMGLVWRSLERENRVSIDQRLAEASFFLSSYFEDQFEYWNRHILELVDKSDNLGNLGNLEAQLIQADPDISDISLWKQGESAGVFDLYPKPKRLYLALNSKFHFENASGALASGELNERIKSSGESEVSLLQSAFAGHVIVAPTSADFGIRESIVYALPLSPALNQGGVEKVVSTHIHLERLSKVLKKSRGISAALVDDLGNILIQSEVQSSVFKGELRGTPLFQKMHHSKSVSNQLQFNDLEGNVIFGGYHRLKMGKLAVIVILPEAEATATYSQAKNQCLQFALLAVIYSLIIGYFVGHFMFPQFQLFRKAQESRLSSGEATEAGGTLNSDHSQEPAMEQVKKEVKWLVNNGSQIIGPLTQREVVLQLYTQELDFDCECWAEGSGNTAQIKEAGIFTGSEDPKASLWMYDGEMIHGPVTPGFILTALNQGAIRESIFICDTSTVQGWKTFAESGIETTVSPTPELKPISELKPVSELKDPVSDLSENGFNGLIEVTLEPVADGPTDTINQTSSPTPEQLEEKDLKKAV